MTEGTPDSETQLSRDTEGQLPARFQRLAEIAGAVRMFTPSIQPVTQWVLHISSSLHKPVMDEKSFPFKPNFEDLDAPVQLNGCNTNALGCTRLSHSRKRPFSHCLTATDWRTSDEELGSFTESRGFLVNLSNIT